MSELFTKNNQSKERNREICAYVFGLQTQRNFGKSFDQVRMQLEIIFLFMMWGMWQFCFFTMEYVCYIYLLFLNGISFFSICSASHFT